MRGTFLGLSVLNRKLLRDLWHSRGQALAIALVIAAGVSTLVMALGAYQSLEETRRVYYERYRFADIFATAKRAPAHLTGAIEQIAGVAAAETRVSAYVLLDIEDMIEPATGKLISLPETGVPRLNRTYLRQGRLPAPLSTEEIAINESFAKAHDFRPGDRLSAIINGRKRSLLITGIVLSPEFIYALGPGDFVPDDRRNGLLWMREKAAASMLDLDGAFNDVSLALLNGADRRAVMTQLDRLLEPYGGEDAYTRADQQSHAFLDAELQQLRAVAFLIPPIFLAVSAFLLNMTLARLITLEREQIGLLKALGYRSRAIGLYYLKFVCAIALVGIILGFALGTWMGRGVTALYGELYHFPFLVFLTPPNIYLIAGSVSLVAAIFGALNAVRGVMALPPAVAMQPPAPVRYQQSWLTRHGLLKAVPQSVLMIGRHIIRFPVRSALTMMGIASSVALLMASLFAIDATEFMIDVTYVQTNRQDVAVSFAENRPIRARYDLAQLPGVMKVEEHRTVPATLRNGVREERIGLTGLPRGTDLTRLLDRKLEPMALPGFGLVLSEKLAELLDVTPGRSVRVEFKTGRRREALLPVTAIIQGYLGLTAYVELGSLNALMGDGRVISGANLQLDEAALPALYAAVKETPAISSIALLSQSLKSFRETLAESMNTMTLIYVALAATIAFGVVYNSVRIQLSERGRELASLRILGFTRREVMTILFGEIIILLIIAIPVGWLAGYALAAFIASALETELYRVPLVINRSTFASAAIVCVGATAASAILIRHRIKQMDLIAVLKTRE